MEETKGMVTTLNSFKGIMSLEHICTHVRIHVGFRYIHVQMYLDGECIRWNLMLFRRKPVIIAFHPE